ncbi:hypothetical protein CCL11_25850 [Pseudomonas syringae]|uniref:hypothetical protein n=1 Tax=Pseudomonas syringae TaxID=317 RepID=UPI000BB5A0E1|nr:hypothetical protein [Pseudomonas syringae]PBP34611.1 hypothetical protein CCL11_25850 [Pseudomonas syringae]
MFNLDANAARSADNKSAFIDEAGKYLGSFTRAEYMEKQDTGSTGIGFTYKTRDGAEAQFYLNLSYRHGTKNDGGHATLNAIMACMQVRTVAAPRPMEIEKWDKDAVQRVKVSVPSFPELVGKPIGLLLQMEIEKNSITGMERPTIFAPFSAESEKTASEILDSRNPAPAKLEKMVQQVMKKPVVDRRPKGQTSSSGSDHTSGNYDSAPPSEWDDIPFD